VTSPRSQGFYKIDTQVLQMQLPTTRESSREPIAMAGQSERRLEHAAGVTYKTDRSPREHSALQALAKPLWILAICVLVLMLRITREALIPLMLAVLFSLILSGIVEALRRRHVPRGVSALILLVICGTALAGAVDALWVPAQEWVQDAPRVLRDIEHRIRPARSAVLRFTDIASRASALAGSPAETRAAAPNAAATGVTPVDVLTDTGWALGGIVTVAVLTLLLLSAGPATLARMTAALAANWHAVHVLRTIDAIRIEVGRYYGTLALVNLTLGGATAFSMWLLHMPNPVLWGALAAVLNFVPYLGSALTLVVVSIVALVTFDSTPHVLLVAATYLSLATIEGQVVEPLVFGHRLHLNPIVVFVALWLGAWLWGVAGVLFALPALLAARVAASQPGGHDGILRFLGSATPKDIREYRIEVPSVPRARQSP
jgi:predicted PurR-regulated permease PerM